MSYRRGGPLTVTDANLLVGKLRKDSFPRLFGTQGDQPLDDDSVRAAFERLAQATKRSPEGVADGFIRIAVENMANAIKRISVARGHDVRRYALACFGGAAGQHACLVADALGISRIFIHPFSGVLSAYGMRLASLRTFRHRSINNVLDSALAEQLAQSAQELAKDTASDVGEQGGRNVATQATAHIRYAGSDTTLAIPLGQVEEMTDRFASTHARQFGFGFENKPLVVESIEIEAWSREAVGDVGSSRVDLQACKLEYSIVSPK